MSLATLKFQTVLFGLAQLLKFTARRHPAFAARLKERNLTAQMLARDEEVGRWFTIKDGVITSRKGRHKQPDIVLVALRWQSRGYAYALWMVTRYPPFVWD